MRRTSCALGCGANVVCGTVVVTIRPDADVEWSFRVGGETVVGACYVCRPIRVLAYRYDVDDVPRELLDSRGGQFAASSSFLRGEASVRPAPQRCAAHPRVEMIEFESQFQSEKLRGNRKPETKKAGPCVYAVGQQHALFAT